MMTLDKTFQALADPTRRAILARLSSGSATVGQLAEPFAMSLPAISRHLRVLQDADLITQEREGKHRRCNLNPAALKRAQEWLDFHLQFWTGTLDRLDAHLRNPPKEKET